MSTCCVCIQRLGHARAEATRQTHSWGVRRPRCGRSESICLPGSVRLAPGASGTLSCTDEALEDSSAGATCPAWGCWPSLGGCAGEQPLCPPARPPVQTQYASILAWAPACSKFLGATVGAVWTPNSLRTDGLRGKPWEVELAHIEFQKKNQ